MVVQKGGTFGKRKTASSGAAPKLTRPTDKRGSDRTAAFKNAKVFIGGHTALDCAVRNLNQEGCMVSLLGAENLPDEVTIRLDPSQPRRRARVAWRDQNDAGLQFLPDE
jgi:PilZ domain